VAKLYRENDYKGIKRKNKKDRNQARSSGQRGSSRIAGYKIWTGFVGRKAMEARRLLQVGQIKIEY